MQKCNLNSCHQILMTYGKKISLDTMKTDPMHYRARVSPTLPHGTTSALTDLGSNQLSYGTVRMPSTMLGILSASTSCFFCLSAKIMYFLTVTHLKRFTDHNLKRSAPRRKSTTARLTSNDCEICALKSCMRHITSLQSSKQMNEKPTLKTLIYSLVERQNARQV